ncbi:major facilitator superfamily-domain-containing protein [Cercophora newfieldiana]|uniref:Major facilitator superfamily-domain-containing protein n=1 Tax=Cercophora newfieldiana TaxID=92897 RepID=A0AA40CKB0_9PEZI|nr:major facilitator superfamily-domain-containing protein [Cercophora newfieldiana]
MAAMNSTSSLGSRQSLPAFRPGHTSVDPSELEKLAPDSPGLPPPRGQLTPIGAPPGSSSSAGHGDPEAPKGGSMGPGGHDPELFQPRSLKFWATLVCNFLALFLVALDRTIIAPAIPRISDDYKALGDVGWYGSAYMLTTACAQLIYGRIYKYYDMKWTFIISVIIFEIGSAICGAAPTSVVFILGRAIAGAASAGIFSGTMLIMIPMIPLHRRPAFQGLFGLVFGLASVMGPIIGGGFTESAATWRWCFYINLPIGAVTLAFMVFFWNPPAMERRPAPVMEHVKRLDPIGMLFFLPATVSLLLALQWGGGTYEWGNWRIVMLFGVFVAATIAFISVQIMKPETALVPPKIITQRSVAFGVTFTFFLSGSMILLVFYVPIWFQTVKDASPVQSGIWTLPLVLSLVFSSIFAGMMTQKIGYYVPSMLIAPAVMSVGEGLMTTFTRDTPSSQWIAYQFLAGFGLGFGMQTSGLAIQTVLPREDISIGIAVNFFLQQLGGAISASIGQAILTNVLGSQLAQIPGFDPKQINGEGITHLLKTIKPEFKDLALDAYNFASQRIFLAAAGFCFASLLCALGMEWRSIKAGKNGQGGPEAGGPGGPGGPNGADAPGGPGIPMQQQMSGGMDGRQSIDPNGSNMDSKVPRSAGYDNSSHPSTGIVAVDQHGNSHYSMMSMPAGMGQNSHYSIIMPSHDPNGSNLSLPATGFDSNNPYNSAIAAPVVFMPHSGDPNNPYGQMGMPTQVMYSNSPYGNSPYGQSGMVPMPVMYVNPAFAPPPVPGSDGHRDSFCNNCRCSIAGIPGMPAQPLHGHPFAESSTSLNILQDDEKKGARSRSGSASADERDR